MNIPANYYANKAEVIRALIAAGDLEGAVESLLALDAALNEALESEGN